MEQKAVMSNDQPGSNGSSNMAISLFDTRVKEDRLRGRGHLYDTPHARALYFKGVNDTLLAIEEWNKMKVNHATLAALLETLYEQTKEDQTVN